MIDKLKRRKKELHLTSKTISEESGVPLSTVQKIFSGKTRAPRSDTLEKINAVMNEHEKKLFAEYGQGRIEANSSYLRETALDYYAGKRTGLPVESFQVPFTVEDYFNIPDNVRVELIDGRLYSMAAPEKSHQSVISVVTTFFMNHIMANNKPCKAWPAPIAVQIDQDDKTMFEPDFIVVCKKGDNDTRLQNDKCIPGAPDFVMEVLSTSSILKDTGIKLIKYKKVGVREYWIVDTGFETVTVHDFEKGTETKYTFDDEIPVMISGGELVIDFKKVKEYISS